MMTAISLDHRTAAPGLTERLRAVDWRHIAAELHSTGYAKIPGLITAEECRTTAASYTDDTLFRSRVYLHRHGFGHGEYQYFRYPLPNLVSELRTALYQHLAPIANCWCDELRMPQHFPLRHSDFVEHCHAAGQHRPTPLLVQYVAGDYNCLHQDIYGEMVFPLQAAVLLSQPGNDFSGGEFVLTEQRPRMQSRTEVVPLSQGDTLIFPANFRPVKGAKSLYRVRVRHGVSRIHSGLRHVLGIIFHDAS